MQKVRAILLPYLLVNPNLGRLFSSSFWGDEGVKWLVPSLKLVRIMLETLNWGRKFTHTYTFRKHRFQYQVPLNFADLSAFCTKNQHFSVKMVPLLKAIVWQLYKRFFNSVWSFCKVNSNCLWKCNFYRLCFRNSAKTRSKLVKTQKITNNVKFAEMTSLSKYLTLFLFVLSSLVTGPSFMSMLSLILE